MKYIILLTLVMLVYPIFAKENNLKQVYRDDNFWITETFYFMKAHKFVYVESYYSTLDSNIIHCFKVEGRYLKLFSTIYVNGNHRLSKEGYYVYEGNYGSEDSIYIHLRQYNCLSILNNCVVRVNNESYPAHPTSSDNIISIPKVEVENISVELPYIIYNYQPKNGGNFFQFRWPTILTENTYLEFRHLKLKLIDGGKNIVDPGRGKCCWTKYKKVENLDNIEVEECDNSLGSPCPVIR